jgi:DNA ligase (NAD+)
LFKKLVEFELNNKALVSKKSPTQHVAKGIASTFDSVAHLVPMLSLSNSYNSDDLIQFDRNNMRLMSAAPEMYEALLYQKEAWLDGMRVGVIPKERHLSVRAFIARIDAALAKARGET